MKKTKFRFFLRRYVPLVKKALYIIGVLAIIFYAYKFFTYSERFKIKSFSDSGVVKFVNHEDLKKIVESKAIGQNVFLFNSPAFEDSLKKNFLGIKTVRVIKNGLNSINIQIQERVPMAIAVDSNGAKYLIDLDGYVLGLVDNAYFDLPTLNYEGQIFIGQFINKNVAPVTMEIISQAKAENLQVKALTFKKEFGVFTAGQSTTVYFDPKKNIGDAIKIVSRLLAKATLDGKGLGKIDLRYDKVIVLYN